jgi:hypothetical protein
MTTKLKLQICTAGTRRAKAIVTQLPPRSLFNARIVAVYTDKKIKKPHSQKYKKKYIYMNVSFSKDMHR